MSPTARKVSLVVTPSEGNSLMTNYICDSCGQWSDAERKLATLQAELERLKADFKQRMTRALLVNEQRLDEITNLKLDLERGIAGLRQDINKARLGDDYLG